MKIVYSIYLFAALSFCISCTKPDGKLEGVITYYFNDNYGDKPDVGATVIVCNKKDLPASLVDSLQLFINAKSAVNRISYYDASIKEWTTHKYGDYQKMVDQMIVSQSRSKEILKSLNITLEQFDKLKDEVLTLKFNFSIKKTHEVVGDGNGRYEVSLPPGKYYALVQSNHRKNYKTGEISGVLDMAEIEIKSSKTVTENFNFSLSDSN